MIVLVFLLLRRVFPGLRMAPAFLLLLVFLRVTTIRALARLLKGHRP